MTQSITKYNDLKKEDASTARIQCLSDVAIYEKAENAIVAYDEKILILATAKNSKVDPNSIKKAQARKQKRQEPPKEIVKPMEKTLAEPLSKQLEAIKEKISKTNEVKSEEKLLNNFNDLQSNEEKSRFEALNSANLYQIQAPTKEPVEDLSKYENVPEIKTAPTAVEPQKSTKEITAELEAEKAKLETAQAKPKKRLDLGG